MTATEARLVIIGAFGVLLALLAGGIFDDQRPELLVVAVIVTGVAAVAAGRSSQRRWPMRLAAAAGAVSLSTFVVVSLAGGALDDVPGTFSSGPAQLLSTDWPSPTQPVLIGTVALGLGLLLAVAADLCRWSTLHLAPLAPIAVACALVVALSAPAGRRLVWFVPVLVLTVVFMAFPAQSSVRDRWTVLAGETRLVPMTIVAVVLAAALSVPFEMSNRSDPRQNDDPVSSLALLDPIEAALALQKIDPPIALHDVTVDQLAASDQIPPRWRTAALVDYDGDRWAPELTLRPIGRRLDTDGGDLIAGSVSFRNDDLQLIPLPGAPVTVEALIETDDERTLVRLTERVNVDMTINFTSRVSPDAAAVDPGILGVREIDETASGFTQIAEAIIAEQADGAIPPDLLGRLRLIETAMRSEFLLDSDASGGGLQSALIERFARDTRRGNAEQFATSFVLLARSLGVDARVATGFEVDPDAVTRTSGAATFVFTSADAQIWPEVAVGLDWVAFDPTPDEEMSDQVPEIPTAQEQTPAAPQPPTAPPPEAADDSVDADDPESEEVAEGLSTLAVFGLQVAAGFGALLVPAAIAIGVVLWLKRRRRRHRLSGTPDQRIHGAWSETTSRLVDAGMSIPPAATNEEIADTGLGFAEPVGDQLRRLSTMSNQATFTVAVQGSPLADDNSDASADEAARYLAEVDASMAASRSAWQRLRWRLSLRSLRRRTRSPV